jgi:hypothetical protein
MWYASRILFLIENEFQNLLSSKRTRVVVDYLENLDDLKDILSEAKFYLQNAFENEATSFFLKSAIRVEKSNVTYFRDFLGLNDTSLTGKPESNDDE